MSWLSNNSKEIMINYTLNADQARQRSLQFKEINKAERRKFLLNCIRRTTEQGLFEMRFSSDYLKYQQLDLDDIPFLEELGFKVMIKTEISTHVDSLGLEVKFYLVSWE